MFKSIKNSPQNPAFGTSKSSKLMQKGSALILGEVDMESGHRGRMALVP